MKAHFDMLALYNRWANNRLYEAAAQLPDEDYRADRGAFFRSVHGTLNHVLVGDRIWMRRFTGEGEAPTRLDAISMRTLRSCAPRVRPRTHGSSVTSKGWKSRISPGASAIAQFRSRPTSSSRSLRRSFISSTTRPITAVRRTAS